MEGKSILRISMHFELLPAVSTNFPRLVILDVFSILWCTEAITFTHNKIIIPAVLRVITEQHADFLRIVPLYNNRAHRCPAIIFKRCHVNLNQRLSIDCRNLTMAVLSSPHLIANVRMAIEMHAYITSNRQKAVQQWCSTIPAGKTVVGKCEYRLVQCRDFLHHMPVVIRCIRISGCVTTDFAVCGIPATGRICMIRKKTQCILSHIHQLIQTRDILRHVPIGLTTHKLHKRYAYLLQFTLVKSKIIKIMITNSIVLRGMNTCKLFRLHLSHFMNKLEIVTFRRIP